MMEDQTANTKLQFIPLTRAELKQHLFETEGFSTSDVTSLKQISEMMEAIWHHRLHSQSESIKEIYESLDPDSPNPKSRQNSIEFLSTLDSLLKDGNWLNITDEEMQQALEGEDVFPISLDVRFDEFEQMKLYKLGETTIRDERKKLFGLKTESVEIETYDRLIQAIQFKDEEWFKENKAMKHWPGNEAEGLHLRLFKSVPKLDLEVVFPNTSPMMRPLDKVKIAAPLIGGFVTLGMKFGPLLFGSGEGGTSIAVLGGILSALGTYTLKTYMGYRKTKEKYLTQVSKDLYFKGQANNQAVLMMVVDLSEEQEVKEALLAYSFLQLDKTMKHTQQSLDERIETWISSHGHDVDFEVDDALGKLLDLGLLDRMMSEDGRWAWNGLEWASPDSPLGENEELRPVSYEKALEVMDDYWDNIFDYSN